MSDAQNSGSIEAKPAFPVQRLLYAIGYGFIAWFVLHLLFVLAVVQFLLLLINGHTNNELKTFCVSLIRYMGELLSYIVFARDEQPFPLGPFPKVA